MINRIFIYSDEEAKKSGCYASIGKNIIYWFVLIIISIITLFAFKKSEIKFIILSRFNLFIIIIVLIYNIVGLYMSYIKKESFATDSDGNIYIVWNFYNKRINNTFGIIDFVFFMDTIMTPEDVAKTIENGPNNLDEVVIDVLKVHSYIEKRKYVEIKCDLINSRNKKIMYNKSLKIYKVYNCFDDLINAMISKC